MRTSHQLVSRSACARVWTNLALAMVFLPALHVSAAPPRCATSVVSYTPGSGTGTSYRNPTSALGAPTRFTGLGIEPGAVTPFRPAFMPAEIVSIGRGGELVLECATLVHDDPAHPFGIDLIVYGNAFCGDLAYPAGVAGGTFTEGGTIELSADGIDWRTVPNAVADGGLPTLSWKDIGPYSTSPGTVETNPALPVNPLVTADSLIGLGWDEILAVYGNAAGGTGIDLAVTGLTSARFIRIRVALDAPSVPEIDAVVLVDATGLNSDLDGNGRVDGADLGILLGQWGSCANCSADLNGDQTVGGADLGILLGSWS